MVQSFASARLIMGLFFVYSCAMSNWLIRLPDVQHKLALEPGSLAICLLGVPVGLVSSMMFSGPVVEAVGARRAIRVGFLCYLVPLLIPGFTTSAVALFFSLVLVGLGMGPLEVGLNVMADRIGRSLGRTVMSRCHGFWSIGMMAGGITGSGAATLGYAPGLHMVITVAVLMVIAEVASWYLPDLRSETAATEERAPVFALPPRNIILLCFFAFGMLLVEGGVSDWSAIYLRDVFDAKPPVTGFAFTAFALLMALCRLAGDWLSTRYSPERMARICCTVGVFGLALMVVAIEPWMVVAGAACAGFGVSIIFPMAVTAAAARKGSPAVNVAALSVLSFSGFLIGPLAVGFAAEFAGLRYGIATLLLAAAMSLILSGEVRVKSGEARNLREKISEAV